MVALDTNVLVRYIVQDDKAQSAKASAAIDTLTPQHPAFISMIVLCEINWVLQSAYKISKDARIDVLRNILSIATFEIEQRDYCLTALQAYSKGKADFADYLIQTCAHAKGHDVVLTFDKAALKSEGFLLP